MATANKVKLSKNALEFFTSESGSNTTRSKFTAGTSEFSFAGANNAAVTLKNIAQPTVDSDAATKKYVDDHAINGVQWKASVRIASTDNRAITGASPISAGATYEGVELAVGDRILLKDQTDAKQNGIYVIKASGTAPERASDLPASSQAKQVAVFVEEGNVNADMGYVCTSNQDEDTVGTHELTFTRFTSLGQITGGHGIETNGQTLNVKVDDSTIEIDTGGTEALRIKDAGVTSAKLADNITIRGDFKVMSGLNTKLSVDNATGDTAIAGTLDVTGDTSVSTFDSSGATSLATGGGATTCGGTLSVSGNTSCGGTLSVTGDTSCAALTCSTTLGVTGVVTCSDNLNVAGDFKINTDKFTVAAATGNTAIAGTLSVDGATTCTGALSCSDTFAVTGAVSCSSTLDVTGATTCSNTLDVDGDFKIKTNKFTVAASSGNTAIEGTLDVTGDTSVSTFDSSGATSLATGGGATTCGGTLSVSGNTSCGGTLSVTGDTSCAALTCSSTLDIDGVVTCSDNLDVAGDFKINTDKFTVAAATGNTAIAGTLSVDGATTCTGALSCSDTLGVTGAVSCSSTLGVTGAVSCDSTLDVTGATTCGGNLSVTGNTTCTGTVSCSSTLDVVGDLKINTDKFTVAAATGNTEIAGSLNILNGLSLQNNSSDIFTVNGTSGNTRIHGTTVCLDDLSVKDGTTQKFKVAHDTGNTEIAGTLSVDGATTCTGALSCSSTLDVNGDFKINTDKFTVDGSTGAVTGTSATFSGDVEADEILCSSDARLKTEIHTITNGLDVVNSLRAVTWKWKPELNMGDHKLAGVVAQEAKAQISHAVRGTKDHLRVDYNSLTGYLISAIHGLSKQVDDLKAQLH